MNHNLLKDDRKKLDSYRQRANERNSSVVRDQCKQGPEIDQFIPFGILLPQRKNDKEAIEALDFLANRYPAIGFRRLTP